MAENSKRNPKLVYSYVKSKTSVKDQVRALVNTNGQVVTERSVIAEVLDDQFESVFVDEDPGELPYFEPKRQDAFGVEELMQCLDETIVQERLFTLKSDKACGVDEISTHVLKMCAKGFALPLSLIFRRSIAEGRVPVQWKEANISPIFKKGSRVIAANYRPVSLTSVVCKVLESIVRDRFMQYLEVEGLISDEQHGFVRGKSCVSNLLETLDLVTKELSEGHSVDVVYLDFLKAFDMVPHRRLVHKLKGFGMRMDLLSWFESFLSNRRQRVVLGDVVSSWRVVRSGVPQGSVLGPLLFVLYINDLPEYVEDTCKLYADDSKLISIVETMESVARTQRSVDGITEWTKRWLVRLNAKKCVVMHFGRANLRANYTIEEYGTGERVVMNESRCERDLGVYISEDLRWKRHIDEITARANRVLGMLVRTFVCRDVGLWKNLYVSLVRPHLEYASAVWNPHLRGDISALEKIQERATRIPTAMRKLPYAERLKVWGLTTLEERRMRGDLIQMYKSLNGLDRIQWYTGPHRAPQSQTRLAVKNELCLRREKFDTKLQNDHGHFVTTRHEFFLNRVTVNWNKLSNTEVNAASVNAFKARIDSVNVAAAIA
jgi:hypothetical protein